MSTTTKEVSLKSRAVKRLSITLVLLAIILLVPAGSVRFWQGWLYVALQTGFYIFFFADLLKNDPQLLERRLHAKETRTEQKLFQRLWILITIPGFILTGLDYRFGWTRAWFGAVPLAVELASQALVAAGYWVVYWVLKANSFAASIIQVEAEQKVIESGPYAYVRHPMYFGMAISLVASPLALGSYVTLPLFGLLVTLLVFRLGHEERALLTELAGYADYCERTRFRLVPWVW